jgi:hypothetical protein
MFVTPGVHSEPEKVLNDQQMNMPQCKLLSSLARVSDTQARGVALVWAFDWTATGIASNEASPILTLICFVIISMW